MMLSAWIRRQQEFLVQVGDMEVVHETVGLINPGMKRVLVAVRDPRIELNTMHTKAGEGLKFASIGGIGCCRYDLMDRIFVVGHPLVDLGD